MNLRRTDIIHPLKITEEQDVPDDSLTRLQVTGEKKKEKTLKNDFSSEKSSELFCLQMPLG